MAKIAFKPTSTIARKQNTVSRAGESVELVARGRHDPCVVPRAVPMVEAMAALVLADQLLQVALSCLSRENGCWNVEASAAGLSHLRRLVPGRVAGSVTHRLERGSWEGGLPQQAWCICGGGP